MDMKIISTAIIPNAEDRIQDIEQMMRFALKYTSLETFDK